MSATEMKRDYDEAMNGPTIDELREALRAVLRFAPGGVEEGSGNEALQGRAVDAWVRAWEVLRAADAVAGEPSA